VLSFRESQQPVLKKPHLRSLGTGWLADLRSRVDSSEPDSEFFAIAQQAHLDILPFDAQEWE
jgi:hypothetical protein